MRKAYLFLIGLAIFSNSTIARSNAEQEKQTQIKGNYIYKIELDRELTINLYDKDGNIIQCAHPQTNGNFFFNQLTPGEYSIKVFNNNGIQSESYYVECVTGEITNNLSYVLNPKYMVNMDTHLESYSCERKSDLKLALTPGLLKDKGELQFTVKNKTCVEIIISNENGNTVSKLPIGEVSAGVHSVSFDATDLHGNYSVSAQAGKEISTCKISVK
jgi:hypothetical protein